MTRFDDAQRARFLCPNAHLHVRPDAQRFLRPDAKRFLRQDWKRFVEPAFAPVFLSLLEGKANFNPNQPRVPKGNPDGGQWTEEGGGGSLGENQSPADAADRGTVGAGRNDNTELIAASRRSLEDCDLIYRRDIFQCRMVGSPACYAQAMLRYAACQRGAPLPPLSY